MVRVNLISPRALADQHLIAEYAEILMLIESIRKYQNCGDIPKNYCLGKGHQKFFRNKVRYLVKRHEEIKKEMKKRGFKVNKKISLKRINKNLMSDYKPVDRDLKIIKKRLIEKINLKPEFYKYYRERENKRFLIDLIKKG